jgi:hypothetical protein
LIGLAWAARTLDEGARGFADGLAAGLCNHAPKMPRAVTVGQKTCVSWHVACSIVARESKKTWPFVNHSAEWDSA